MCLYPYHTKCCRTFKVECHFIAKCKKILLTAAVVISQRYMNRRSGSARWHAQDGFHLKRSQGTLMIKVTLSIFNCLEWNHIKNFGYTSWKLHVRERLQNYRALKKETTREAGETSKPLAIQMEKYMENGSKILMAKEPYPRNLQLNKPKI